MNDSSTKFLMAVLGKDGAKALYKASQRAHELENAIIPRAILAWLNVASVEDYEGELPGVEDTYINFAKHDGNFSGAISIGDNVFTFSEASVFHVASCIAVSLGADADKLSPALKDLDLTRLGKTIDVLAKATFVTEHLRKAPDRFQLLDMDEGPDPQQAFEQEGHDTHKPEIPVQAGRRPLPSGARPPDPLPRCKCGEYAVRWNDTYNNVQHTPERCFHIGSGKDYKRGEPAEVTKVELPGKTHLPTQQIAQTPPQAPAKQPKVGQPPKPSAKLKVVKSQLEKTCPECSFGFFNGTHFTGCFCFKALSKSTKVTEEADGGVTLQFGSAWDEDSIIALIRSLK